MIHVVLLSGGSGTRLWPLSSSTRPKQFLKVLRNGEGEAISMVQRVLSQIESVGVELDITIATSAEQIGVLTQQIGERHSFVAEPERRDTAPAIMLACAHLELEQHASADDPVVVMPIDTFADQRYYNTIRLVSDAVTMGSYELVLLGVTPTYPSNRFGYILPATNEPGALLPVKSFQEKPDEVTASSYIAQGGLWNCGVFGFKLGWLRELTSAYLDVATFNQMVSCYSELPRNSFDYEVVEKAQHVAVIPYTGTWKDLGTWDVLCEELAEPTSGPVWIDDDTSSNVHVINKLHVPVVISGISDAVVVATNGGILIANKAESTHIKSMVEEVERHKSGGAWQDQ